MAKLRNYLNTALKKELEKMPLEEHVKTRIPYQNVYQILQNQVKKNPNKEAIIFLPSADSTTDFRISYQALFETVNQTARAFQQLGIQSNDVVSWILPNCPEAYYCSWAAESVAIANAISPEFPDDVILNLLEQAKTKIIVMPSPNYFPDIEATQGIRQQLARLRNKIQAANKNKQLSCKMILLGEGKNNPAENIYDFYSLINAQSIEPIDCKKSLQDPAIIFHTSSSTSVIPKLVQFTQLQRLHAIWSYKVTFDYRADDRMLMGLPFFHVGAALLYNGAAFDSGATVIIFSPMGWKDPSALPNFWKLIERYQATTATAIPPIYIELDKNFPVNADISSLDYLISGWPAPPEIYQSLQKKMPGVAIINIYGMTESGCIITMNPPNDDYPYGGIGLALPYQAKKIVICENGNGNYLRDAKADELGMICVKGINFGSYLNPELQKQAYLNDNWFITGDMGRNINGYDFLECRHYDYMQRKAQALSCFTIENKVDVHPAVKLAAVIQEPDAVEGEIPRLYVELQADKTLTASELIAWMKQNGFSDSEIPRHIIFGTLPINGMGKVIKPLLKQQLQQQLEQLPA